MCAGHLSSSDGGHKFRSLLSVSTEAVKFLNMTWPPAEHIEEGTSALTAWQTSGYSEQSFSVEA